MAHPMRPQFWEAIEKMTGVPKDVLLGPDRTLSVVLVRHVVSLALHREGFSKAEIGRIMHRDHTSSINSINVAEALLKKPESWRERAFCEVVQSMAEVWRTDIPDVAKEAEAAIAKHAQPDDAPQAANPSAFLKRVPGDVRLRIIEDAAAGMSVPETLGQWPLTPKPDAKTVSAVRAVDAAWIRRFRLCNDLLRKQVYRNQILEATG